jgi:cobalt/nickel transport system permease protein
MLLRRFDPRGRLVAAVAFAIAVVAARRVGSAALALAAAAALAVLAGVRLGPALRRLGAMEATLALLLATLPFSVPGEPLLRVGPLVASDAGLARAALVLLKANAVVLAMLALVGTQEASRVGWAMHRLRVPDALVHLLLFTVRYLGVLDAEYGRLRAAMRARAFRPRTDAHSLRSLGNLVGMLLVRSAERAERVMAAMRCRGFTGRLYVLDDLRWRGADSATAAGIGLAIAALVGVDRL